MKRWIIVNVPCALCKEMDVKHYANGMCRNCDHRLRYAKNKKANDILRVPEAGIDQS